MPYDFCIVRRVEFSETDMAGIVHFSQFFRYMESAEHAFFRSLGHSIIMRQFDPPLGWPRVHAACDYLAPLQFEDEIEIRLLVREKRARSLSYLFRFHKLNSEAPVEVARGSLTTVCVVHRPDGTMKSTSIPQVLSDQIQVAPPELLHPPSPVKPHPKPQPPTGT
jgi:YbgC/YbaW family acyl-CoA thioester hydrolase